VAQPEDLVIHKAIAWRPDLARVGRHVRELGEAMEQDRMRELDAVIHHALAG
jgi:hypothetical protein